MIKLIFITLLLVETQANSCFDLCTINGEKATGRLGDGHPRARDTYVNHRDMSSMERIYITNYHCIMKCANMLTKATMDYALNNDEFNFRCILLENLDYCVQYWKKVNGVDCEGPIKNMVKQNFQVSVKLHMKSET